MSNYYIMLVAGVRLLDVSNVYLVGIIKTSF